MHKPFVRIPVVMLAAVLTAACGLERGLVPLVPPISGEVSNSVFKFRHSPANAGDTRFEGYEVYYKFYTPPSIQFDSDRNRINEYPPVGLTDSLRSLGFRRIGRLSPNGAVDITPLVTPEMIVEHGSEIVLNFAFIPEFFDGEAFLSLGNGAEKIRVVRDLESEGGKLFNRLDPGEAGSSTEPGDPDLSTNVKEYLRKHSPGTIEIALVAFATGFSIEDLSSPQVLSRPLVVGKDQIGVR